MIINNLMGLRVASIHYPAWSEYFDENYILIDQNEDYILIGPYRIEKSIIQSVSREKKTIRIDTAYHHCVRINLF